MLLVSVFGSRTLDFGARAMAYFWGSVAGMMVHFLHQIVFLQRVLWLYVDDFLVPLGRQTSPLWE